jgi:hypothetical protein
METFARRKYAHRQKMAGDCWSSPAESIRLSVVATRLICILRLPSKTKRQLLTRLRTRRRASGVAHARLEFDRTFRRGVRELLEKKSIFRSTSAGVFFVNGSLVFNGDRLAFMHTCRLKGPQRP